MRIKRIDVGEMQIPLVTPFKTSLRTATHVDDIIVRVVGENDQCGFGEAAPTAVITGDIKPSIRGAIEEVIAPSIVGMDIEDIDGVSRKLRTCILKNTSAKAAVDLALYDLYAKTLGKPLYKVLGGNSREVETDITISVDTIDKMVADSVKAVEDGYRILKVKVGKEGLKDVERIRAIRDAIGEDKVIRVDANQGWTAKEAVRIIRKLEDLDIGIDLVEQPVSSHDKGGMIYVTANTATPILADESVFTPEDAIDIIHSRAADLINIKLMKTGGIYEALKIAAIGEIYNVPCMMGCMLESKISVSAGAHLAGAKGIITRADLDGPGLCSVDPYEGGPVFNAGSIILNDTPGIGIESVPCFED